MINLINQFEIYFLLKANYKRRTMIHRNNKRQNEKISYYASLHPVKLVCFVTTSKNGEVTQSDAKSRCKSAIRSIINMRLGKNSDSN